MKREHYWLCGILLIGAILRAWYLADFSAGPDFAAPGVDAEFHDYWARGLVTGDWTPPPNAEDPRIYATPYLRPPGYPYFLAGVYRVFGLGYHAPRVVQMILGLASALLAFAVARRWFGTGAALVTAALMAWYWIFIYFEAEFHAPVLMIFLTLCCVYALGRWAEHPRPAWAVLAGVLFGLSALVLPNVLLFGPFAAIWMLWVLSKHVGRRSFKAWAVNAGALTVATLAAISPATIRNYRVSGEWVLITTNGGINLYIGNHEGAAGYCLVELPDLGKFETCFDYPALMRNLEAKLGRSLSHRDVDAYFRELAINHIRSNPKEFLRLTLQKALMFWGPSEISHNKEVALERRHYSALLWTPFNFLMVATGCLAGCAAVGVELARARQRAATQPATNSRDWPRSATAVAVVLILFVAAFFLSILPFFSAARYRVPIIPPMIILTAIGLERAFSCWRQGRKFGALVITGAAVAAVAVLAVWPFRFEPDLSNWHYSRGVCLTRTGRLDAAIEEYNAAIRADDANAKAHFNLGMLLQQKGRHEEAARHLQAVAQSGLYEGETRLAQARLFVSEGRHEEAVRLLRALVAERPDDEQAWLMLANLLADRSRPEEAIAAYQRALAINSKNAESHYNLGAALAATGRLEAALDAFSAAAALKPDFEEALNNRAAVLVQLNRLEEAVATFQQALRRNPESRGTQFNLCIALTRLGRTDDVIAQLTDWLRRHPGDADAALRLGDALMAAGRPGDAVAHYEMAARAFPGHAVVQEKLDAARRAAGQ